MALAYYTSEWLINSWDRLPDSVDFISLLRFKRSSHSPDTVDFSLLSLVKGLNSLSSDFYCV